MKSRRSLYLCLYSILTIFACTYISAQNIKVANNTMQGATIFYSTGIPTAKTIVTNGDTHNVLILNDCHQGHDVGMPSLPQYSRIIETPLCEEISLHTEYHSCKTYSYEDLNLRYPIRPSQPHRSKNDSMPLSFSIDNNAYQTDSFYGGPLASVQPIGIARSRNLARLTISPIAYNPVRREILIYDGITVHITYKNSDRKATIKLKQHETGLSPILPPYIPLQSKETKSLQHKAPLRYLIVAHSSFRGALDDFISWKRRQGFITTVAYTDDAEVGTTAESIAAYIKRQYTEASNELPAPDYLLLVGDIQQIPSFRSRIQNSAVNNGHFTDLYYATWTDDYLPDCLYGRFSANNINELQPQIDKSLLYEQYAFEDPSYLSKAVLVAGVDEGRSNDYAYQYSDPQMDYIATRYINTANGFKSVYYYKNNTDIAPAGVTVSSSAAHNAANELKRLYTDGCGWINYSAHGVERGWVTPTFTVNHIASMNNYGKPSIMIGNCCLTNHFNSETCFGEQLLRRGENAGAAAYIGAITDTYWDDDLYWTVGLRNYIHPEMHADGDHYDAHHLGMYDRLFHAADEPFDQWYVTMGGMIYAGNMAVEEAGEDPYSQYYWEIYTLMGDPSLMPWLGEASPMTLDYTQPVSRSLATIVVTTEPYAYVSLTSTDGTQLLDAAYADAEGNVSLTFDNSIPDSILQIAAFAQNQIPVYGTVQLTYDNNIRMGISGVRAYNCVAGDTVDFSFRLANLGSDTLHFINYVLRGNPSEIRPLHTDEYIGELPPRTSVQQNHVCQSLLDPGLADQSTVPVTLQFISDTIVATCTAEITVNAPKIVIQSTSVKGVTAIDSTISLCISIANRGHADAHNTSYSIFQPFQMAHIEPQYKSISHIAQDNSIEVCFTITIDSSATGIRKLPLQIISRSNGDSSFYDIDLPFYDEDFELEDFDRLGWQNDEIYPWIISDTACHGHYAARSHPGMPHRASSSLSLAFNSPKEDSLSFNYLISSEADNDLLYVTLDSTNILIISGIQEGWKHFSRVVGAGAHLLTFRYRKDESRSQGSDAAWIDDIILPDRGNAVLRYHYDSICQGSPYQFYGQELPTETAGDYFFYHESGDTLHRLRLSVLPMPTLTILTSDSSVFPGQTAYLAVAGATTYIWSTGDSSQYIRITPTDTTTLYVTGTQYGCSATDSITIGIRPLSIDLIHPEDILIYPNPTSTVLHIQAPNLRTAQLLDIYGKQLIQQNCNSDQLTLDLNLLPNGIYLLRLSSEAWTHSHKIIKR